MSTMTVTTDYGRCCVCGIRASGTIDGWAHSDERRRSLCGMCMGRVSGLMNEQILSLKAEIKEQDKLIRRLTMKMLTCDSNSQKKKVKP